MLLSSEMENFCQVLKVGDIIDYSRWDNFLILLIVKRNTREKEVVQEENNKKGYELLGLSY